MPDNSPNTNECAAGAPESAFISYVVLRGFCVCWQPCFVTLTTRTHRLQLTFVCCAQTGDNNDIGTYVGRRLSVHTLSELAATFTASCQMADYLYIQRANDDLISRERH